MEKVMANGFEELSCEEANMIEGGGPEAAAVALVALCGTALVGGFVAGRAFVRDIRNKNANP